MLVKNISQTLQVNNLRILRIKNVKFFKSTYLKILPNSQENKYAKVFYLIKLQLFSSELWEIFKNNLFTKRLFGTAFDFIVSQCLN